MYRMLQAPSGSRTRVIHSRLYLAGLSALLALLLAGCGAGVSTSQTGASSGSTSKAGPGGAVMTIRPCLGVYNGGFNPAVTLTNFSSSVSGNAHIGDTIELRLDSHHNWNLTSIKPVGALNVKSITGAFDSTDGTCVWELHASASGDAVITFTGLALCDPTQTCPQFAIAQTFKLHIS